MSHEDIQYVRCDTVRIVDALNRIASALETPPCPTMTGAQSADTREASTPRQEPNASQLSPPKTADASAHATSSAAPPTGDPDVITQARKVVASASLWGRNVSTDFLAAVLAADDAEVAHHARTTATLQAERAALTIERAKFARITAILIDPMLTDRQAVERALPVAKGEA